MFYSRRHYERLHNGAPDTADAIAERVRHREAVEQASREFAAKFPVITPDMAREVADWQKNRVAELLATTGR